MTDLKMFTKLMDDLGLGYTTKETHADRTIDITIERSNMHVVFVFGFDESFRYMYVER